MEYNELFEKYRRLLEENQRLLAENENLRKRLGLSLPVPCTKNDVEASIEVNNIQAVEAVNPGHVTNSSSPEDKINSLCALEGAIQGIRWHYLDCETKAELKRFFDSFK